MLIIYSYLRCDGVGEKTDSQRQTSSERKEEAKLLVLMQRRLLGL